MSVIPTDFFPAAQIRQTSLSLYDQGTKSELFQVKAYNDKAELNSNKSLNLNAEKVNIYNSDGTMVMDVASTILSTAQNLATEVSDRTAAVSAVSSALVVEEEERIAAVAQVAATVATEQEERIAAVSANSSAIVVEEEERIAAVSSLQSQLEQEVADRQTAVSDETSRATAKETELEQAIAQEETRAKDVEDDLQAQIESETSERMNEESSLHAKIDAEIVDRMSADNDEANARQASITAAKSEMDIKIAEQKGRIDGILSGSTIDLDSFSEVVSFYNSLDTDRLANIVTLQTNVTELGGALGLLTQRFNAAFGS